MHEGRSKQVQSGAEADHEIRRRFQSELQEFTSIEVPLDRIHIAEARLNTRETMEVLGCGPVKAARSSISVASPYVCWKQRLYISKGQFTLPESVLRQLLREQLVYAHHCDVALDDAHIIRVPKTIPASVYGTKRTLSSMDEVR